jgi:hypothetical protein
MVERSNMPPSRDLPELLATAIGYLVANSAVFEAALDRSLALLIHGPQWRPAEIEIDPSGELGVSGLKFLEELPDPRSVEILLARVQLKRRADILFELLERWWPDSTRDASVQRTKREIMQAIDERNLAAHGHHDGYNFRDRKDRPNRRTAAQLNKTAKTLFRLAHSIEGHVYTWLGQAPTPP